MFAFAGLIVILHRARNRSVIVSLWSAYNHYFHSSSSCSLNSVPFRLPFCTSADVLFCTVLGNEPEILDSLSGAKLEARLQQELVRDRKLPTLNHKNH